MSSRILAGIPVSSGISIGRAFFMGNKHNHLIPRHTINPEDIENEIKRLERGFEQVRREFEAARTNVPADLKALASIIDLHLMVSNDPKLMESVKNKITNIGITAEWALEQAVSDIEKAFNSIDDSYFRERIQDIRTVADRILARLLGMDKPREMEKGQGQIILIAHDLTPADTIELDVTKIMAFATTQGGKTSHSGILARSLHIPALVGVTNLERYVQDGQPVIVDALRGKLLLDPSAEDLLYYADLKFRFEAYHHNILHTCTMPGETMDGIRLDVLANVDLPEEIVEVISNGGEGIGLLRTEYAFLNRKDSPTEEELYNIYSTIANALAPNPVVFRTLDIGADKLTSDQLVDQGLNPALGLRAIRYCLRFDDIFKRQIRAILRAGAARNASMMFPMIADLEELHKAKELVQLAKEELIQEGLPFDFEMPIGIMIEVPSAVMTADILAKEVDFFSIGTNDLIQYSLGVDRTNSDVAYLYQPLHPAVLRSIKYVVDSAHEAGIEVGVCGELASDPYCFPILVGMSIDGISVTPQAIPGIKRIMRRLNMEECTELVRTILSSKTTSEINAIVKETIFKRFPDELMFYSSVLDVE